MIQFKDKVKEFSESGQLETQIALENHLIQDLKTKLMRADPKDHIEMVSVKGMLEGLFRLQSRRQELIESTDNSL